MSNLIVKIVFVSFCLLCGGRAQLFGSGLISNPLTSIIEAQIQAAQREQQALANRLVRNGVQQVSLTGNQVQIAKNLQSANINRIATQGLLQVWQR